VLLTFWQRAVGVVGSVLCVVVLHYPMVAQSTVVEPLSMGDLAAQSQRVVRADVVARYVLPHRGDRGEIYTRIELRVRTYLLGDGPREITVQQLGGQIGDIQMVISGNANFEVGQEVIAYLDYEPSLDLHYVIGLAQGLFVIDSTGPTPTVHRDLDGLSFYQVIATPMLWLETVQTLETFLSQFSPRPIGFPTVQEGELR